ncbi:hypothetical protein K435DRAFT_777704 [Dendrothele bispora CBS 962.96]|uniref:Uncharacterized protein n=1 Tax=Dendrothele bispora (strain CBS 962.96) TaxID=1314807 RepID=A0A4S8M6P3_DENBC|nr:hypothetical protein K435DRAFT_777704 [Dendrothele bispora CBS 962.96]
MRDLERTVDKVLECTSFYAWLALSSRCRLFKRPLLTLSRRSSLPNFDSSLSSSSSFSPSPTSTLTPTPTVHTITF